VLVEIEEVNADLLRRLERNNPASLPNQYIVIYNYKNDELYSSEGTNVIPLDTAFLNKVRLQNEVKFTYKNYEALGFLYTEKYERYTVIAAATDVYGLDALRNLRNVLLITLGASAVFVSILGWIYAGRVLRPISKIVSNVAKITEVNLTERLDEGKKYDELGQLAATFNKMLSRLQSAFAAQKNFIANASHEIKTPITVMSAEIEVSLLQDRSKEHYVQVLRSVLGGLKALNKLSSQLLLLAQTTADQPLQLSTFLRIDDILWLLKDELLKGFPNYWIDINLDMALVHESLQIHGDEELLKVAILNLMDNGCKYSPDNHVTINLSSPRSGILKLEFVNAGAGIDPSIQEKIFEPFYRGVPGKQIKGFGIGLSLVHRIIQLHHGTIHVKSTAGLQTVFTVELPSGFKSL
jgi:signal transduction histidine kinase